MQLIGFMDHWTPSVDAITTFWKSDLDTVRRQINEVRRRFRFNNFTFYTKWYTNGIYSTLPFLRNHPDASNTRTRNDWGRRIIKDLHDQGLSVGAVLQMYTFEQPAWGTEAVLDIWDLRAVAATDQPNILVDFTHPLYRDRFMAIVEEQLTQFPGLDYCFLEFEGLNTARLLQVYPGWAAARGLPPLSEPSYAPKQLDYLKALGVNPAMKWSIEGQGLVIDTIRSLIAAAEAVFKKLDYRGTPGLVYHLLDYECLAYPQALAGGSRWWLVPWFYWGWEKETPEKIVKQAVGEAHLRAMQRAGFNVCYMADVTIACWDLDSIRKFYYVACDANLAGYLGMGHPNPEFGLRWTNITQAQVAQVCALYEELLGTPEH